MHKQTEIKKIIKNWINFSEILLSFYKNKTTP